MSVIDSVICSLFIAGPVERPFSIGNRFLARKV